MVVRTVLLGERPAEVEDWLARRQALGLNLFDEVWEGEYHVAPAAHSRHGDIDQQLAELLGPAARAAGMRCLGPVNIGQPLDYRLPDRSVVEADAGNDVFLPAAVVVVEIVSPDDETHSKFGFYFDHAVTEILVVDPGMRTVTWFGRADQGFLETAGSAVLHGLDNLVSRLRWPD